ncbi:hypothetical protein B0H14DRAFT_3137868 [Mycena olivaceomarginata]|nr:hypothetical protein B0H14DRAFT_3137868 [Mycena olivaceomarginata]
MFMIKQLLALGRTGEGEVEVGMDAEMCGRPERCHVHSELESSDETDMDIKKKSPSLQRSLTLQPSTLSPSEFGGELEAAWAWRGLAVYGLRSGWHRVTRGGGGWLGQVRVIREHGRAGHAWGEGGYTYPGQSMQSRVYSDGNGTRANASRPVWDCGSLGLAGRQSTAKAALSPESSVVEWLEVTGQGLQACFFLLHTYVRTWGSHAHATARRSMNKQASGYEKRVVDDDMGMCALICRGRGRAEAVFVITVFWFARRRGGESSVRVLLQESFEFHYSNIYNIYSYEERRPLCSSRVFWFATAWRSMRLDIAIDIYMFWFATAMRLGTNE